VASLDEALAHLQHADGVMLGRAAYHEPGLLGAVDRRLFGEGGDVGPVEAVESYRGYIAAQLARGVHLAAMTRHMLGLFHGRPGARAWRRILTMEGVKPGAGLDVLDAALAAVAGSGMEDERRARRLEAGEPA
jgi:tRNA-dihydrouridine synthase A